MKFYHIWYVYRFGSRQGRDGSSHGALFHGENGMRFADRQPSSPGDPLPISRSGRWLPDLCFPGALLASEQVKEKLAGVPNIVFHRVKWAKLVDLPYFAPGDFSYRKHPAFLRAAGAWEETLDDLYKNLPDVPALRASMPACYELLFHTRYDVGHAYELRAQSLAMPDDGGRENLKLSPELLRDYPIIFDSGIVISEAVFPLLDPHIDRDFFDVVEGET